MFQPRPCGCKGLRSCKICEANYGAWEMDKKISKEEAYIYCPLCRKIWPGWEVDGWKSHPDHAGESLDFPGVALCLDWISRQEEEELVAALDAVPWDPSQSGRYKQNYGPKCNFKKRKSSAAEFVGFPRSTKFIQDRFETLDLLAAFETAEQCSLDYTPERGSSIDPHVDDCWIWGERIPTLSLLSDSVLTLTPLGGACARYNLADVRSYPRVVSPDGQVLSHAEAWRRFEEAPPTEVGGGVPGVGVVRIPMPRRSLLVLFREPRYEWEHSVLREDIATRRVCITYRELTPLFGPRGPHADVGAEIVRKGKRFWDPQT